MKERAGFVSNSSSASYYVTLKGSREEILSEIEQNCSWPHISVDQIRRKLRDRLKGLKIRLDDIETKKERFLIEDAIPIFKERISNSEAMLKELEDISRSMRERPVIRNFQLELTEMALDLNHIGYTAFENEIHLQSRTVMHNSYCEGMPDMLKDIVLYYSFENPERITVRVEHQR